jgi:hypothetical protein
MRLRTPAALTVALGWVNAAAAADVAPAVRPAMEPAYRSGSVYGGPGLPAQWAVGASEARRTAHALFGAATCPGATCVGNVGRQAKSRRQRGRGEASWWASWQYSAAPAS